MNSALADLVAAAAKEGNARADALKVLPQIVSYVGAERGSLFLLSGDQVIHRILANKEAFSEVSNYKVATVLSAGLAGWSLKHRQGGLASDVELDDRWTSLGDKTVGSALVVPMISRGLVIGLIALHHPQRGYFRERHLALAAEAAMLIAPIFDSALLTESTSAALVQMCQEWTTPSVLLSWSGVVLTVNQAMNALDIAWDGVELAQTVLARELRAMSVKECCWEGDRVLTNLPYSGKSIHCQGVAVWIRLSPK